MTVAEAYAAAAPLLPLAQATGGLLDDVRRRYVEAENARRDEANAIVGAHVWGLYSTRTPDREDAIQRFLQTWLEFGPRPEMALCSEQEIELYVRAAVKNYLRSHLKKQHMVGPLLSEDLPAPSGERNPLHDGIDAARPEIVAQVVPWVGDALAEGGRRRYNRSLFELHTIKRRDLDFDDLLPYHASPNEDLEHAEVRTAVANRLYQWHRRDLEHLIDGIKYYADARGLDAFRRACLLQAAGELFQRKFGPAELAKYVRPLTDAKRRHWERRTVDT
jgi:hypothetical protein